jgi:hypothetical protein
MFQELFEWIMTELTSIDNLDDIPAIWQHISEATINSHEYHSLIAELKKSHVYLPEPPSGICCPFG